MAFPVGATPRNCNSVSFEYSFRNLFFVFTIIFVINVFPVPADPDNTKTPESYIQDKINALRCSFSKMICSFLHKLSRTFSTSSSVYNCFLFRDKFKIFSEKICSAS